MIGRGRRWVFMAQSRRGASPLRVEGGTAMSNVFYGIWMARDRVTADLGWDTTVAWFIRLPIWGTIQLSSFSIQEGDRFAQFRRRYAMAYIETVNTPTMSAGGVTFPNPDKLRDNNVFLTTDHITFQLQTDGVVSASGFGMIHDMSSTVNFAEPVNSLAFAVFDEDGAVLGTHREVQLYGGKELDGDDIQQAVLTRASAEADRQLDIIPVDPSNLPAGGAFRIDTRTRRPIPLDRPAT
jgi:hypothetical protein